MASAEGAAFQAEVDSASSYVPEDWADLPEDEVPMGISSPTTDRILLAVSSDAETWIKTGEVLAEWSSVPCVAVDGEEDDERVYVFFNSLDAIDGFEAKPAYPLIVASSADLVTWTYDKVSVDLGGGGLVDAPEGYAWEPVPQDPSVVRGSDGTWYLYFTLFLVPDSGDPGTGFTFVATAATFPTSWTLGNDGRPVYPLVDDSGTPVDPDAVAIDPNVMDMSTELGGFQYFSTLGDGCNDLILSATDAATIDTENPARSDTTTAPTDGVSMAIRMSNGYTTEDGRYRWLAQGSDSGGGYTFSFTFDTSTATWMLDSPTPILEADKSYEQDRAWDAAAVYFKGCYVMAYVTEIPT